MQTYATLAYATLEGMTLPAMGTALITWIVAIAAPGPDVFQILRVSTRNRRAGVWCALGIMVGNSAWIILSLAGLSSLVKAYPVILSGLKIVGGAVLCWMGWASLRGGLRARGVGGAEAASNTGERVAAQQATKQPVAAQHADAPQHPGAPHHAGGSHHAGAPENLSWTRALRLGILTNLSNPKALLFFGAVFANFVHPDMGVGVSALLAGLFIVVGLLWFTGVALLASLAAPLVARHSWVIDVFSGVLFLGVGAAMLITALSAELPVASAL